MKRGPNPVLALCVIETTDERDKLRQQLADLRIVAEGLAEALWLKWKAQTGNLVRRGGVRELAAYDAWKKANP